MLFGKLLGCAGGTHLEAHDVGVGCRCQCNIAFADGTYGFVYHIHLHFLGRKFEQCVAKCFVTTCHVGLNDDVEFVEAAESLAASDVFECDAFLCLQALFALQLFALRGYFAHFLLGVHHIELVAGGRSAVQAKHEHRGRWSGFFHALVALVEHGFHLTEVCTCQDVIAHMECTVLNEHCGHIAATLVERRLDDAAHCVAVRVGFEFEQVGFE